MPAPSTMTSALLGPFKFQSLWFAAPLAAAGGAFPHYMTNLRLMRQIVSATRSAQQALALDAGLALGLSSARTKWPGTSSQQRHTCPPCKRRAGCTAVAFALRDVSLKWRFRE